MKTIDIMTDQNFYSQNNQTYFNEIIEITKTRPTHYLNIIRGKKYLVNWINDVVEKLKDKKYDLRTKVYWIINNITDFPICKNCKCKIQMNIRNLRIGYGKYCSRKCANSNCEHNKKILDTRKKHKLEDKDYLKKISEKIKQTKLELYGDANYTNREKARKTILQKYGKEWFVQTDIFEDKSKKSLQTHYGVDHVFKSAELRNKAKQTKLELYGDVNYTNREKARKTCEEKYGVDNPAKSKCVQAKMRATYLKLHGVDHNFKDELCKEKIRKTNIQKYGVPYPMSCRYKYDGKFFDSSWEVAYYIWLKDNNIKFEYHTKNFTYKDENGKEHIYELDFVIYDNDNKQKFIEIKGDYLLDSSGKLCSPFDKENRNKKYNAKFECMKANNVEIISSKEILPILQYVAEKYGKSYIRQFKQR